MISRAGVPHGGVRVLAVGEDQQQIAGRVEELERLEERHRLFDSLGDERALIGERGELVRLANERQADQEVVVVVGEWGDDVGVGAEFHERQQIAIRPAHPHLHEALGRGDRRDERVGLESARCGSFSVLNGLLMLFDASIMRQMRRPG